MTRRGAVVLGLWVLVPLAVLLAGSALAPAPPGEAFEVGAAALPRGLRMGEGAVLAVSILNRTDEEIKAAVVDMEVYQGDRLVFQGYVEGRDIKVGGEEAAHWVRVRWTPVEAGVYVLKVGVFSKGWREMLHWSDNVASLKVAEVGRLRP